MTPPPFVTLLTQRITIERAENLHCECPGREGGGEGETPHPAPCYGIYDKHEQTITLDADLKFERERDTFLHENLHAMFAIVQFASILPEGMDEHIVTVLSPILLSWLRDNPDAVNYLMQRQP